MSLIDALRDLLWSRDRGLCGICGEPVARALMGIDHIQPTSSGGADSVSNLRTAHRRCNTRRGAGREGLNWADLPRPFVQTRAPANQLRRLQEWRLTRALTQEELAEKADITRVALARIEACKAEPRPSTTRALAKALSVKVEDLMAPLTDADA